jgi:hypothetical protein
VIDITYTHCVTGDAHTITVTDGRERRSLVELGVCTPTGAAGASNGDEQAGGKVEVQVCVNLLSEYQTTCVGENYSTTSDS